MNEEDTFDALRRVPFNQIEDMIELGKSYRNGTAFLPDAHFLEMAKANLHLNIKPMCQGWRNVVDNTGWTYSEICNELKKRYGETK